MKKELSCIIVDDELRNQVVLEKMLDRFCPTVQMIGTSDSVDGAIELIKKHEPDIVFLDIEMPEENGFQLLDKIEDPKFSVIFTTAHAEYALKAIKYAAMDYLLKPINLTELKIAVEKVSSKLRNSSKIKPDLSKNIEVFRGNKVHDKEVFVKIALSTQEGIEMVDLKNILSCQAQKNQTIFHLVNSEKLVVNEILKEYENLLPSNKFRRTHKSHLVNLDHVKKYQSKDGGKLLMSDDSEIEVAVRRRHDVITWLKQSGNNMED